MPRISLFYDYYVDDEDWIMYFFNYFGLNERLLPKDNAGLAKIIKHKITDDVFNKGFPLKY